MHSPCLYWPFLPYSRQWKCLQTRPTSSTVTAAPQSSPNCGSPGCLEGHTLSPFPAPQSPGLAPTQCCSLSSAVSCHFSLDFFLLPNSVCWGMEHTSLLLKLISDLSAIFLTILRMATMRSRDRPPPKVIRLMSKGLTQACGFPLGSLTTVLPDSRWSNDRLTLAWGEWSPTSNC